MHCQGSPAPPTSSRRRDATVQKLPTLITITGSVITGVFSAGLYSAHRAVIFAIAQLSCFQLLLQLQLLAIFQLQLQLQLTDAYFPVITGFQLQLLLTGITLGQGEPRSPALRTCRSTVFDPLINRITRIKPIYKEHAHYHIPQHIFTLC